MSRDPRDEVTPEAQAISAVSDLLRAAVDATENLEREWSATLDVIAVRNEREDYRRVLGQALKEIEGWASEIGQRLAPRDLDRLSTGFPLEVADLATFDVEPVGDQQIRQLWIALFYALRDAGSSFAALNKEGERQATAREGQRVGSFWEAGSFTLLRQRILALADVTDRIAAVLGVRAEEFGLTEQDLRGALAGSAKETAFARAQALVRLGFHDAALPFLLLAFNNSLRPVLQRDDDGTRVGLQVAIEVRRALVMLVQTSSQIGQGVPVPPEVAVPLAETLIGLLSGLVVVPAEPLATDADVAPAAADDDTDAPAGEASGSADA